jgi:3' terminal RNA ribose 2'-O-methyltransferase Hen1
MILTITTTTSPATDLGYLLHKNPARVQSFTASFGQVHVFYPQATPEVCTAALLLDIDPVGLVRGRRGGPAGENHQLEQFVNDRPYVASSFMSVAIADVFSSALNGHSKDRPELAQTAIPLTATLSALPCRGGEALLRRLFEPLGYTVETQGFALDETFPDWGPSRYFNVTLSATCKLRELLTHLYVLVPVLDSDKHYWVGDDEVEKLLKRGGDWLGKHPEQKLIVERYLKYQHRLMNQAFERLLEEDQTDPDVEVEAEVAVEEVAETPLSLHQQRLGTVLAILKSLGAQKVLDLGCGEGRLLRLLLEDKSFTQILGMDVSYRTLEVARDRLRFDRLPPAQKERLTLVHGSLLYRDTRLSGYDAAAVVEVIEHLDPPRLAAFERTAFEYARPGAVVITTPNAEYNVKFEALPAGKFRHGDHRFEWSRTQFESWAKAVAVRFGYAVRFAPIGPLDEVVGAPSQMAVFTLQSETVVGTVL